MKEDLKSFQLISSDAVVAAGSVYATPILNWTVPGPGPVLIEAIECYGNQSDAGLTTAQHTEGDLVIQATSYPFSTPMPGLSTIAPGWLSDDLTLFLGFSKTVITKKMPGPIRVVPGQLVLMYVNHWGTFAVGDIVDTFVTFWYRTEYSLVPDLPPGS